MCCGQRGAALPPGSIPTCEDLAAALQTSLSANRIIAGLPAREAQSLAATGQIMDLPRRAVVQQAGELIEFVYFPLGTVFEVLTEMNDGTTLEAATVGREGMTGLPVFLGARRSTTRTLVSTPGPALRIDADLFRERIASGSRLCSLLGRYTELLFIEAAQLSACNRVHSVAERCARWLLMANDRLASTRVATSQAGLAHALGVRRASVTKAWGDFASAGIATPSRGAITITDRQRLEGVACECYFLLREQFESANW